MILSTYLAVFSKGWLLPTNLRRCSATFAISSLRTHRRLRKEVGYPTIFSASLTALFQSGFELCCATLARCVLHVLTSLGPQGPQSFETNALDDCTFTKSHLTTRHNRLRLIFPNKCKTQYNQRMRNSNFETPKVIV